MFAMVADPVGSGFIENLARPGGKITGFTNFEPSMGGKWLEVLREASPATRRVLVLMHPETTAHKEFWRSIEASAGPLQVEAIAAGVHNAIEIERAFVEFTESGKGGGVIALPHAVTEVNRDLIIQQAIAHLMPSIFAFRGPCPRRRACHLRDRSRRCRRADGRVCGSYSPRHQTRGPAGSRTGNVRTDGKPQNSESARPHYFADAAGPRR